MLFKIALYVVAHLITNTTPLSIENQKSTIENVISYAE